jgi:hypothetical protein
MAKLQIPTYVGTIYCWRKKRTSVKSHTYSHYPTFVGPEVLVIPMNIGASSGCKQMQTLNRYP